MTNVVSSNAYGLQYEKEGLTEYGFIVYLEGALLKTICVGNQPMEQPLLDSKLLPLCPIVRSLESRHLPLSICGVRPLLLRVLSETREDRQHFVVTQRFVESILLQCFQQAHQNVFGM